MIQKGKKNSTGAERLSTRPPALKSGVSVVIPVEPGGSVAPALEALKSLPKAEKALIGEVFVAEGRHPSRQRNLAVSRAKGAWILFLDSDSRLQAGSLAVLLGAQAGLDATVVGGPNLPLLDEPFWGRVFQGVIGSWLGSMRSRARYAPVGLRRLATEKELILCNLLVERAAFSAVGGFREDLYPNEENELFNRLQAQGHRLAYEPQAWVRRPRRAGVAAFATQAFRYGRGRAQQMRANFFASDLVNLLPLALVPLWAGLLLAPHGWQIGLFLVFIAAFMTARGKSFGVESMPYLPMLALRHHAYAAGLVVGAFQGAPQRPLEVRLTRIKL